MRDITSKQKFPSRKSHRLKNYDYSTENLYFVTLCTKNREKLFGKIIASASETTVGVDAHIDPQGTAFNQNIRLTDTGKVVDKYIQHIPGLDCYCVMPDHIHLILYVSDNLNGSMWASTPTKNLSQVIKSFKILVSKEIGFSIWQRSFYDHIIRDYYDYQIKFKYIENNALNWVDKHQT